MRNESELQIGDRVKGATVIQHKHRAELREHVVGTVVKIEDGDEPCPWDKIYHVSYKEIPHNCTYRRPSLTKLSALELLAEL
jgi:hypothetical protein